VPIDIQRPSGGPDVTRQNPRATIYIGNIIDDDLPANETTDGSVRLRAIEGEDDNVPFFELRTDGVWNDVGVRISSDSLEIGRDMNVSSAGGFLETFSIASPVGHQRAVIPHNEFNESGTQGGHMPILDALDTFVIFSTPVSEIVGAIISQQYNLSDSLLLDEAIFLSGTVAATQEIVLSLYVGTDNTGPVLNVDQDIDNKTRNITGINASNLTIRFYDLIPTDFNEYAALDLVNGAFIGGTFNSSPQGGSVTSEQSINIDPVGGMVIKDSQNDTGFKNNADYSANFDDRSLVDKEYADFGSFLAQNVQNSGIVSGLVIDILINI